MSVVGRAVERTEDSRLVRGQGEFVADVMRPGQVHARLVRSRVPHARIVNVDLEAARAVPGVLAAVSAQDAPELTDLRIPVRLHPPPDAVTAAQPPLAGEYVRYVGEPVAVVVAEDPRVAEQAAYAAKVEVEELPVVLGAVAAAQPDAFRLHPMLHTNVVGKCELSHGPPVDEVFARADVVIAERLSMHRHAAVPMETRGLVAEVGDDGRLTVWGPTKVKHAYRLILARLLGLEPERIRILEPDVGGSFGARGEFCPEDFLIPWLALRVRRPVKWIEDRFENLVAMSHSREHVYDIQIAARRDGTLLAFQVRDWCDMGAYLGTAAMVMPEISARHLSGAYRWEAFEVNTHAVLTNKTPICPYRGPGEAEATFCRERALDLLAVRLEMDPAQLRLQNLIAPEDLPIRLEFGPQLEPVIHNSGNYREQFRTLLNHIGYQQLRAQVEAEQRSGRRIGLGLCCFINEGSYGPFEWARVVAEPDGTFTGFVGSAASGQGGRTSLAQILAQSLEVPFDRVHITHNDTDVVQEGVGSWADRTTAMAGSALLLAAHELRRQALERAASALRVEKEELELAGATVRVRNDGRAVSMAELECAATGKFERTGMAFTFGASCAIVSIDPETGRVTVRRYVGAYDAGRTVNPLIVQGQLNGAAAQGISGALFEHLAYASDGQPLATSFHHYVMATASEIPPIESLVLEYPAPDNPLGVKGMGNPGIVGTYGALANAVGDAVEHRELRVTALPLRPPAVYALLRESARVETEAIQTT